MWPLLVCYLTHGLFDKYFSTYVKHLSYMSRVNISHQAILQLSALARCRCKWPDDQLSSARWLMFWQNFFGLCEIVWRCIHMSTKSNSHQRLASVKFSNNVCCIINCKILGLQIWKVTILMHRVLESNCGQCVPFLCNMLTHTLNLKYWLLPTIECVAEYGFS